MCADSGKAVAVQGDVAKAADVKKIFAEAKAFGRLDILVNNAGVYNLLPLEGVREQEFHRHFNINVLGLLLATQEAAKHFGDGRRRHQYRLRDNQLMAVYGRLHRHKRRCRRRDARLAKELGPRKIRVNSIKPGVVETEGTHTAGSSERVRGAICRRTPLGRTEPDDIAPVAVFLASDESRWVTGDTLTVSGGLG